MLRSQAFIVARGTSALRPLLAGASRIYIARQWLLGPGTGRVLLSPEKETVMGRQGRWSEALRLLILWCGLFCVQAVSPATPTEVPISATHKDPCQARSSSHGSARNQELLSCSRAEAVRTTSEASRTLPSPHHESSASLRRLSRGQVSDAREHARILQAAGPPPQEFPILAPRPPPAPPDPDVEILAPQRTYRKNPLQGLRFWAYGWNILDINYWASLIWSGVPAAVTGLVWLLAGLLVLAVCISAYACCRARRARWRSKKVKHHKAVTIGLLAFGGAALAMCISGFVLLCVGQVGLWAQAKGDMQFIVDTTELTTDIIKRLAQFMQVAANASVGNVTIPPEAASTISAIAAAAISTSDAATAQVQGVQNSLDSFLFALGLVTYILTAILLLLVLFGIAFVLWRKKWLSFVCIGFMWALCVFALAMLTVTLDLYNFIGDTQAALDQVVADPGAVSAMQYVIPCTNQSVLNITGLGARRAIYSLVNLANSEWNSSGVPPIHVGTSTVSQLCNPFQGPPDYLPVTTPCHPNAPNLTQLAQAVNGTACAQDPAACSTAKQVVQVAMLIVIVMAVVLQTAYPSLGVLVNCKYVAQVATAILGHAAKYYDSANEAWIGYLLLSLGGMLLCLLLPFYVIRALRAEPAPDPASVESISYSRQGSAALNGEQSMKSFASCNQSFHDDLADIDVDSVPLHPVQSSEDGEVH